MENIEFDQTSFNEKILKDTKLNEFVNVIIVDSLTSEISYLDFDTAHDKSKTDKTYLECDKKYVVSETRRISVTITREQIKNLEELWNIDVIKMSQNVLVSETKMTLQKQLVKRILELANKNNDYKLFERALSKLFKLFKKEYVKKIKVRNVKELVQRILCEANNIAYKSKIGPGNFIICSSKTATLLLSDDHTQTIKRDEIECANDRLYLAGVISDSVKVYVDPMMDYENNTIIIGRSIKNNDTGLNFIFYPKGTTQEVIEETDFIHIKININLRCAFVETGKNPEYNYSKFVYKGKLKV